MNEGQVEVVLKSYVEALGKGDAQKAGEVIGLALNQGMPPMKLYSQVLVPAAARVCELARGGSISVAEEHLASEIMLHEMTRLKQLVKPRAALGTQAVVASVNDGRDVSNRVIADYLSFDGWEVHFLGRNTPRDALAHFVADRRVNLVCLSVANEDEVPEAGRAVQEFKKVANAPRVIVAGPAMRNLPEEKIAALGADAVLMEVSTVPSLARKVCGLAESQATLSQYLKGLGERILKKRKERRYTQQELAGLANLDRAYISSVEHGKQNMTIGAIYKLADALEVPLEELLVGNGN